ncbi:hypothetical protein HT105_24595, partial [Bacteroides fragilis]|nr:hypothetical protein [Bacteroides fragilis]
KPVVVSVNDPDATVQVEPETLPEGVSFDPATNITVEDKTAPVIDPIEKQDIALNETIKPVVVSVNDPDATVQVEPETLPEGVSFDPATN